MYTCAHCTIGTKKTRKICYIDELIFLVRDVIIFITKKILLRKSDSKEIFMKNAKRILIAILAIALVASVFAFSVSAEDEIRFRGEGIKEFDDILEFYELEEFINLDFSESEWTAKLWRDNDHTSSSQKHYRDMVLETIIDPSDENNMLLNTEIQYGKGTGFKVEPEAGSSATSIAKQLMISFDVKFDENCVNNMYFDVKVGLPNRSSAQVLRFDFRPSDNNDTPTVQYVLWDAKQGSFDNKSVTVEDFVPAPGVWYSVEISFNTVDDTSYTKICADGVEVLRIDYEIPGADGIKYVDISSKFNNTSYENACKSEAAHNSNVANFHNLKETDSAYACGAGTCRASIYSRYCLDNLKIYEGSFARDGKDRDAIAKLTLEDFRTFYESGTLTFEEKFALAQTLAKLYALDSNVFTDEVASVLPEGPGYVNEIYATETVTRVNGLDKNADYYARYDYAHNYALMYDYLPANNELAGLPGMTDELIASLIDAREIIDVEKAELAVIKQQSEDFIALIQTYDPAVKDYFALNAFYDQATSDLYTKRALEYEGMAVCTEIYEGLVERVETMNADVYAFVNHVTTMEYSVSFGFLFAAYEDATASYYKYSSEGGVINPGLDNSTHPQINDKIAYYLMKAPIIQAKAKECDEFVAIMDEAKNTTYYTSLVGKLEEATPYLEVIQSDYPGVSKAIAMYYALCESVSEAENASEAYIAAVKAIEGKTDFYEKKTAVEAALVLKALGDVLGYEGVKEANVALAEAEADINFREGSSTTLIALVAEIKVAKSFAEKRNLIRLATVHAEGADDAYIGVTEAKAALADAVASFEAAVNQANKAVAEANKVAVSVASGVAGGKIFH